MSTTKKPFNSKNVYVNNELIEFKQPGVNIIVMKDEYGERDERITTKNMTEL
jgi:hypothetical protein